MSTAIIVPHEIPATSLEIVKAETIDHRAALLYRVASFPGITTPEIAEKANALLVDLDKTEKDIEAQVERHSKPAHGLHKAILAVGKKAIEPINFAKVSMRDQIGAWNRKQEEALQAAQAKADAERKAAEEAAEKERARLQAIADKEHAEALAAAEAERLKIQAQKDAEAKELEEIIGAPVVAEVAKVEMPKPVEVRVPAPAAPAVVVPLAAKSAVTTRMVKKLIIKDPQIVPAYINGIELRTIDAMAVKAAIDSGVIVPGACIEMVPIDVIRGGA